MMTFLEMMNRIAGPEEHESNTEEEEEYRNDSYGDDSGCSDKAEGTGAVGQEEVIVGESPMDYPDGGPRKENTIACGNYHLNVLHMS